MQLKMLTAVQLVEKTMTCILRKMGVWFVVCFCYLASILIGTGIGMIFYAFNIQSSILTQIGTVIGLGACGYFAYKLRGSTLLPVRVGHVRVLVEQMSQEKAFDAKLQIQKYQQAVTDDFDDIFRLAKLERKVRSVLQAIYVERVNTERFAFGNERVKKVLDTVVGILVAFIGEVILAYSIKHKSADSPDAACRKALSLFAQNVDSFSTSIRALNLLMFTGLILCYSFILFPIEWVTGFFPVSVVIWSHVVAMIFAWGLKAIFLESVSVAAFIPVFFDTVKGQKVKAETTKKLGQLSDAFSELK